MVVGAYALTSIREGKFSIFRLSVLGLQDYWSAGGYGINKF